MIVWVNMALDTSIENVTAAFTLWFRGLVVTMALFHNVPFAIEIMTTPLFYLLSPLFG